MAVPTQARLLLFLLLSVLHLSRRASAFVVTSTVPTQNHHANSAALTPPPARTLTGVRLTAKPKHKRKKWRAIPTTGNGDELPANLKRTVSAKRPFLGHVVPKHSRKGTGGTQAPQLASQGVQRTQNYNNPRNLQIIAGMFRGRKLDSPDMYLRPMMAKVREAVYSTLTSVGVYDQSLCRHLDIFAGSGSVGLESLSRGATHCTFVDLSQNCCDTIRGNWNAFSGVEKTETTTTIVCGDALQVLNEPSAFGLKDEQPYQVVTICPPYEEVVYADLLEAVAHSPLLQEDTIVVLEYPVELGCLPHVIHPSLVGFRNRKYGRTVIAMYINQPTGKLPLADSRPEEFVSV